MQEFQASQADLVLLQQAELLAEDGRHAEARAAFEAALATNDGSIVHNAYGCYLAATESFREAIQHFTAVLELAGQHGRRDWMAVAAHNLAGVYRDLGDFDLAARFQQRAVTCQESCGPEDLLQLANDALVAGNYGLAERLVQAADDMSGDRAADRAAMEATLGLVLAFDGRPRDGIGHVWRAYGVHQRLRDRRAMGADLVNLAAIFALLGRRSAEVRCLRRAIRHYEEAEAGLSLAKARALLDRARQETALAAFDPRRN